MSCVFKDFYFKVELLNANARCPERATLGDAGMDIFSPEDFVIQARSHKLIPVGFRYNMPDGYALIIKEKSGIATKRRLSVGAAVCDARYVGQVHVHLFNHSDEVVTFNQGDKIAQALIVPIWDGYPEVVDSINTNTDRGEGGFGSTGTR